MIEDKAVRIPATGRLEMRPGVTATNGKFVTVKCIMELLNGGMSVEDIEAEFFVTAQMTTEVQQWCTDNGLSF